MPKLMIWFAQTKPSTQEVEMDRIQLAEEEEEMYEGTLEMARRQLESYRAGESELRVAVIDQERGLRVAENRLFELRLAEVLTNQEKDPTEYTCSECRSATPAMESRLVATGNNFRQLVLARVCKNCLKDLQNRHMSMRGVTFTVEKVDGIYYSYQSGSWVPIKPHIVGEYEARVGQQIQSQVFHPA